MAHLSTHGTSPAVIVGTDRDDTLAGDAGQNRLDGGAGNDILDGGAGDDVLVGGPGTNVLRGGEGSDTVDYSGATAGATVDLAIGTGLVGSGGYAGDRYDSIENVVGTAYRDHLRGDDAANRLAGGADNDVLRGLGGDDVLDGGAGADQIDGGDGIDTADYRASDAGVTIRLDTGLAAGGHAAGDTLTGIENLVGSAHADTLTGDAFDNVIEGGAGADQIDGGAGSDTATYAGSGAGVWIDLARSIASGGDANGDRLTRIENLVGSAHDDWLAGDAGANRLEGGGGDDVLIGGEGGDWLDGGDGIDTADYSAATGRVVVGLNVNPIRYAEGGVGYEGEAAGDRLFNVENLIGSAHGDLLHGDEGANRIEGRGGDDHLVGAEGDDVLVGGDGADLMEGGTGIDTVDYAAAKSAVHVDLGAGTASGGEAEGDRLSGIENLVGTAYGDVLAGDGGANRLAGGAGDDRLIGAGGADTLDGGEGIDTAVYAGSAAGVGIDLAAGTGLGGDGEGDRLSGIENVEGSRHDDVVFGDAGSNRLDGGGGNDFINGRGGDDILVGGEGGDWLDGGDGIDTADYSNAAGRVVVGLNVNPLHHAEGGMGYEGEAAGDRLFNIENLIGSAYGDLLHGDDGQNRIEGGAGDDHLVGAGGDDWLIGGAGADTIEGGDGIDTVDYSGLKSGIDLYLAGSPGQGGAAGDRLSGVENAIGTDHADLIVGDNASNRLEGGKGDDRLFGGSGDDWLIGGQGMDILDGGAGIDTVDYSAATGGVSVRLTVDGGAGRGWNGEAEGDMLAGIENVVGTSFNDALVGDQNGNRLDGGDGRDVLEGFGGNDVLIGGSGNDTLWGDSGDDWLVGGTGADQLHGGTGTDTADYSASDAAIAVDLGRGTGSGGHAEGDTLDGVDSVIGTDFADVLNGSDIANYLQGNDGDDALYGHGGDDALYGGAGDDVLVGGDGNDQLVGHDGNDRLDGGAGDDAMAGGAGDDILIGGDGTDALDGGDGGDWLISGKLTGGASDRLTGGRGADTFVLGEAPKATHTPGNTDWGKFALDFGLSVFGDLNDIFFVAGRFDAERLGKIAKEVVPMAAHLVRLALGIADADKGTTTPPPEAAYASITDFNPLEDVIVIPVNSTGPMNIFLSLDTNGENAITVKSDTDGESGIIATISFAQAAEIYGVEMSHLSPVAKQAFLKAIMDNALVMGGDGATIGLENKIALDVDKSVLESLGTSKFLVLGAHSGRTIGGGNADEYQFGTNYDDIIAGYALDANGGIAFAPENAGNDELRGFGGDDLLLAGGGNDYLFGGSGSDTASYVYSREGIVVRLGTGLTDGNGTYGTVEDGFGGFDKLYSVENIIGSRHDDDIRGDAAANTFRGMEGDDVYEGGGGADRFVLDGGVDRILDFSALEGDRLVVSRDAHGILSLDDLAYVGPGADGLGRLIVGATGQTVAVLDYVGADAFSIHRDVVLMNDLD